ATVDDLAEYLSIFRRSAGKNSKRTPTHIEITIDSNKWNARGAIGLPNSSPVDFTASFPLPIGTDWSAFLASPLSVTLEFPSIFLANAPQFFHPEIFREGVLSGNLSLSETLQHPRITGEAHLVNCKLQNAPLDLIGANGRVTFSGNRASLDFFNAATND